MKRYKIAFCLLLFSWFFCNFYVCQANTSVKHPMPSKTKRVLIVDSHTSADRWSVNLRNGLQSYLASAKEKIKYENFEFGVRFRDGIKPSAGDIAALQVKLNTTNYDLIIVSNNPATNLFLDGSLIAPKETPILVTSYQGGLPKDTAAKLNMTGIETPISLKNEIELWTNTYPEHNKIAIITEASADGLVEEFMRDYLTEEHLKHIAFLKGSKYTTPQLLDEIKKLPLDSLIIFHSWSSSLEEDSDISYTVLPKIKANFAGLIFGKYDCYVPVGAAGGFLVSGVAQGKESGKLARLILNGKKTINIPIQEGIVRPLFDLNELKRVNFPIEELPSNTVFLNKEQKFWTEYKEETGVIVGISFFLVFLSLVIGFFRRQAQKKISLMFSHLPVRVAVCTADGNILYFHVGDELFSKYNTIKNVLDFPEDLGKRFLPIIQKVFQTGKSEVLKYQLLGHFRQGEFVLLPKRNPFGVSAVMWISTDITELTNSQIMTQQISERFRLTLESIGDGVIATDKDERVTLINPIAAEFTGYSAEEAIGRKLDEIFDIVSYIDGKKVQSPITKALQQGITVELANHTDLIAKDGTRRHISDSAAPIRDADGKINGGVLVFRDVTKEYNQRDLQRMNSVLLKKVSEIAKIAHFQCDSYGTVINEMPNEFWAKIDNEPIEAKDWIVPENFESFNSAWRKLLSGEVDSLEQTYAANDNGVMRYFDMRVEKSINEINGKYEFFGIVQDISENRSAEITYRNTLDLFQHIMDNLPGYIFVKNVSDSSRYLLCNKTFELLTGADRNSIEGKTDKEIFSLDDDAALKFQQDDLAVWESQEILDTQDEFVNIKGQHFTTHTVKCALDRCDGTRLIVGMGFDVSRQRELELAQEKTIMMLNQYVENERIVNKALQNIIYQNDFDKSITDMLEIIGENSLADRCYVFRFESADFNVSSCTHEWVRDGVVPQKDNLQEVDLSLMRPWVDALYARKEIIISDINNPPENLEEIAEFLRMQDVKSLIVCGIWIDNQLYGFVGFDFVNSQKDFSESDMISVHNIANLFILSNERIKQMSQIAENVVLLTKQKHELQIAMEQAQAADHAKSYFLATISHELRTPLNAVIGFSELLQDGNIDKGEQIEYLRSINFAGNALLNLINDVLDLSKLEAEQLIMSIAKVDVAALIMQTASVFKLKAKEKNLALNIDCNGITDMIYIDQLRLRQIILNLVGNAIKFTSFGSVSVEAKFVANQDSKVGCLMIKVWDTGIGISEDNLKTIFDPFVQADVTRGNKVYEGSGLGLAISKRLLDKMDGSITVESKVGEGSIFTVVINDLKCDNERIELQNAEIVRHKVEIFKAYRLLLVDDVPMNLSVLSAMLKKYQVESVFANSGEEALEILNNDTNFDGILTDLWMPEMSGEDLANKLKIIDSCKDIPVFAITADTQLMSSTSSVFRKVLYKPITQDVLQNLLNDISLYKITCWQPIKNK